ncbi:MAG TPA: thioredoxin family protein [Sedimentisphaerales bacterium]|nr:thioredoxin family protein [Sedimentisphaerales bacterium]
MMAPILEELKEQYKGTFEVVFIDVWKNPGAGAQYGIKLIPTQIFYDATGKELFRHEGFFSKEDILAKWKELGVDLSASGAAAPAFEQLTAAAFLSGEEEATGRSWVKAFTGRDAAVAERAASGGSFLALDSLAQKEMSHRCGFCDRACYPQDAAEVIVEGAMHTWGCCSHCALGVAARTGNDIEVREKDRLTKQPVVCSPK